MFSRCSEKRRYSDKDLLVNSVQNLGQKGKDFLKIIKLF